MTPVQSLVQVELNFQDHYSQSDCSPSDQLHLVAASTWSDWFALWLTDLAPTLDTALATGGDDKRSFELSLRLTDDREIQDFNATYRQQDCPTDVLAFAALESSHPELPADQPLELGDIIISVPTAFRQAQERGHSLTEELAWLACHGLLHLLGWEHPDEMSLQRMLQRQTQLLSMIEVKVNTAWLEEF